MLVGENGSVIFAGENCHAMHDRVIMCGQGARSKRRQEFVCRIGDEEFHSPLSDRQYAQFYAALCETPAARVERLLQMTSALSMMVGPPLAVSLHNMAHDILCWAEDHDGKAPEVNDITELLKARLGVHPEDWHEPPKQEEITLSQFQEIIRKRARELTDHIDALLSFQAKGLADWVHQELLTGMADIVKHAEAVAATVYPEAEELHNATAAPVYMDSHDVTTARNAAIAFWSSVVGKCVRFEKRLWCGCKGTGRWVEVGEVVRIGTTDVTTAAPVTVPIIQDNEIIGTLDIMAFTAEKMTVVVEKPDACVAITAGKTGERWTRRWVLQEPHRYGPEDEGLADFPERFMRSTNASKEPVMSEGKFKAVIRDYHAGGNRPYRNIFHSAEDENTFDKRVAMDEALEAAGVTDGDEVEITVRKTGKRWTRRWVLQEPHRYGPEDDELHND